MFLSNIPPSSTGRQSAVWVTGSSPIAYTFTSKTFFLLATHSSPYANVWANANPACQMCLLSWRGSICFVLHLSKAFLTSFFLVCCCGSSVLPAALLKLFISQQHAGPIYPHGVRHHNTTILSLHSGLWAQSYASKHFWESLREKYHRQLWLEQTASIKSSISYEPPQAKRALAMSRGEKDDRGPFVFSEKVFGLV